MSVTLSIGANITVSNFATFWGTLAAPGVVTQLAKSSSSAATRLVVTCTEYYWGNFVTLSLTPILLQLISLLFGLLLRHGDRIRRCKAVSGKHLGCCAKVSLAGTEC